MLPGPVQHSADVPGDPALLHRLLAHDDAQLRGGHQALRQLPALHPQNQIPPDSAAEEELPV